MNTRASCDRCPARYGGTDCECSIPEKKGHNFRDLTGQRFHRLLVLGLAKKSTHYFWKCVCDCGSISVVRGSYLTIGMTKSCGCLQREAARAVGDRSRTHGLSTTGAYVTWNEMLRRCTDPRCKAYRDYGARGISVCERWQKFENFLADMGHRPEGMTLDRRDNSKGYSPDNCRWATHSEQCRNTRRNRHLEVDGLRLTIVEWSERTGIPYRRLQARIASGWTHERAVKTAVGSRVSA